MNKNINNSINFNYKPITKPTYSNYFKYRRRLYSSYALLFVVS